MDFPTWAMILISFGAIGFALGFWDNMDNNKDNNNNYQS